MLIYNSTLTTLIGRENFSVLIHLYLAHINKQNFSAVQQKFLNMFTAVVATSVQCILLISNHDDHCYVLHTLYFTSRWSLVPTIEYFDVLLHRPHVLLVASNF